jgi:enamidase
LILLDAPRSSAADTALAAIRPGDLPSITAVVTDGVLRILRSRNTPPPKRMPVAETRKEEVRA